jgi:O-antigen ligase
MTHVRPKVEPSRVLAVAAIAAAALALGVVSAVSPLGTVVLLGLTLFVVAATLPLWLLPSISLWLFALIPIGYITGVPTFVGRFWTPAALVLAIWAVRLVLGRGRRAFFRSLRWMVPLTVLLLALGFQGLSSTRSVNWTILLIVAVALPTALVSSFDDKTSSSLLRSWFVLGIGLSLVAVIESLVENNPLTPYYNFPQHWSVYRVTTTLGHPLLNGTFFAVTACLAAFSMVRKDGARAAAFLCFVLTALAAGLTGSRSGVYALVSGLGVGLLVLLVSGRTSLANKLLGVVLGTTALLVLPALPTIAGRASSAEGVASGLYRDDVVRLTGKLFLADPWFGYGPGTSLIATARSGASLPLENSVLGSLVSLGVIGSLGVLFLAVLVLLTTVRGGRPDGIAAVASFVVAGAAFPLWESNPAALVLVGFVLIATRVPAEQPDLLPAERLREQLVARDPLRHKPRTLAPVARVVRG